MEVPAPAWPLFAGLGPLGALPTAPKLARMFIKLVLPGWNMYDLADDCELIISELTSNVIRTATGPDGSPRYDIHGRLPVLWVRLLSDHLQLRVEVWDNLPPELGLPQPRRAAWDDVNGRGLDLVANLSLDWGWDRLPSHDAKRVWALLKGTR